MQKDIHPENHKAKFVCACGNNIECLTTKKGEVINMEICSNCHPFFTKKQKIVDASGRVDKFNKRFESVKNNTDKKDDKVAKSAKDSKK